MTFDEYQRESRATAFYPNAGKNFIYPTLGVAGESGELANKVQKIIRDEEGAVSDIARENIRDEIGDVLWFLAQLATELNLSFGDIADSNMKKLLSRKERGVIQGSGDTR